jgi:hypothetical protein
MSSQSARKRVQPLNLGSATSTFFRKPNVTKHEPLSRKRPRVSKSNSSVAQPPPKNPSTSLFTFTQALATTLPGGTGASDDRSQPDADRLGSEQDAPLREGGNDDGGLNRAPAGKVFGNSRTRRCVLTTA